MKHPPHPHHRRIALLNPREFLPVNLHVHRLRRLNLLIFLPLHQRVYPLFQLCLLCHQVSSLRQNPRYFRHGDQLLSHLILQLSFPHQLTQHNRPLNLVTYHHQPHHHLCCHHMFQLLNRQPSQPIFLLAIEQSFPLTLRHNYRLLNQLPRHQRPSPPV